LYSACKLAVFEALRQACRLWGMPYAHARFFYQHGPWEAANRLVPAVITSLLAGNEAKVSSGEQVRDFLHVDDVASAIAVIARSDIAGAVNVGSGVPVQVRDVVLATAEACGRPDLVRLGALPQRPGDPPFVCADPSRLRQLGWSPRFGLEDGLIDTVAWYKARV
jgi:UDP-glucuronate decarboxylase